MDDSELDLGQTIRGFSAGQKLFGRYSLVRILGRGGMGVVWLARDQELGRDVALKFLPELLLHDRAALGNLKRETCRSLELTHPHIVRIYDFVQDDRSACISMEHVDGDTLSNMRFDKPSQVFEPEELTQYVRQLCDALDYAHKQAAIVHRDLKPSNLMVNRRDELKVADFGIARGISESVTLVTMNRGSSGTLVYMSPQQLGGERVSPLDDIYSLGATLYELLTSKPPFYSGAIEHLIREKVPPSISARREELGVGTGRAVPIEWEQTIAACLAKQPSARPQSVKEVAARLIAAPETIEPRRSPGPATQDYGAQQPTPNPSRYVLPLSLAAVCLVILALCIWLFAFRQPSNQPTTAPSISTLPTPVATAPPSSAQSTGDTAVTIPAVLPINEETIAVATPEPTQSAANPPPRDAAYLIKQIITENINAGNDSDITRLMTPYAETVDFLDEGIKSREAIAQDLPAYFAHWPIRHSTLVSEIEIQWLSPNERKATFTIDIEARNPGTGENRANRVDIAWTLRRYDAASDFKIVAHKQRSASQASEPQLQQMVNTYVTASSRPDIATLISLYADQVDFLDEGIKSRNVIEREMHDYFARWPIQRFTLASDVSVTSLSANERKVSFKLNFTASNPVSHKTSEGSVDVVWIVRRSDPVGVFKIVSQKQKSIKRSN